jgi:nicotinate-nucleotide adenylyltransferase
MSEKRDLWVPVLVILAGLGICAWDVAVGRGLSAALAALVGLAGGGGTLALTLRKHSVRAAGLAVASILFLASLSPAFEDAATSIAPFGLAGLAVAFHARALPPRTRAALLGLAGVLALLAAAGAVRLLALARPATALALAGAFACAVQVVASRPRPEAGPPPGPSIGVFGGSFDPWHVGHRAIAEAALKAVSRLLVVVAARPPHKAGAREPTPFHHRVALARLGVEGLPRTEVLELEGRREGPSYTVDTLEQLRRLYPPGTVFHLILGADSYQELPMWHDWEGILERADLLVAARPGADLEPPPEFEGRNAPVVRLDVSPHPVSSTEVRSRIARGKGPGDLISPAVAAYVRDHALYVPDAAPATPAGAGTSPDGEGAAPAAAGAPSDPTAPA